MHILLESQCDRRASRAMVIPVTVLVALGLLLAVSNWRQGLGLMLGSIPLAALIAIGLRAMRNAYAGCAWELSPAGVRLLRNGAEERLIAWDAVKEVRAGSSGAAILLKEAAEEIRIAFVSEADAMLVRDCWRHPELLQGGRVEVPPPGTPTPRRILAAIGIFTVLFFGVLAVATGFQIWQRHRASSSWPSVEGTVIESAFEFSPSLLAGNETCAARLRYEYVVDGRTWESGKVSLWSGDLAGDCAKAKALIEHYPAGSEVQVFYDPTSPGDGVLDPGMHSLNSTLVLLVGLALTALGGFLTWRLLRTRPVTTLEYLQQKARPA